LALDVLNADESDYKQKRAVQDVLFVSEQEQVRPGPSRRPVLAGMIMSFYSEGGASRSLGPSEATQDVRTSKRPVLT
jgi:hypothetical protein